MFSHLGHLWGWLSIWQFMCSWIWALSLNALWQYRQKNFGVSWCFLIRIIIVWSQGLASAAFKRALITSLFFYLLTYSVYAASNSLFLHIIYRRGYTSMWYNNVQLRCTTVFGGVFRGLGTLLCLQCLGGVCSQAAIAKIIFCCLIFYFINLCHTTH